MHFSDAYAPDHMINPTTCMIILSNDELLLAKVNIIIVQVMNQLL